MFTPGRLSDFLCNPDFGSQNQDTLFMEQAVFINSQPIREPVFYFPANDFVSIVEGIVRKK
jgi:hypothetical protein